MKEAEKAVCFYFTDRGYFFPADSLRQKKLIHGNYIVEARVSNPAGLLEELWAREMNMAGYLYLLWEENLFSPNVEFKEVSK